MKTIVVRLPWPPSVNHYYGRTKTGRVFLKEPGRLYRKKAAGEFARLGWPRLEGPVAVTLLLSPPDRRKRDIDNPMKCFLDSLSDRPGHKGVIGDDSLVKKLSAEFVGPDPAGKTGWVDAVIQER